MIKKIYQNYWPHGLAVLIFLIISAAYFAPLVGGKKVMFQHDIKQALGMAQEVEAHKAATGEQSLWTNSMFGGMPTYQIKAEYPNNWSAHIFSSITYVLGYDRYPITSLWLLMTTFFFMLLAFKVKIPIAFAVAIGYGFTTYNLIGLEAGHANKIWTLMYAPIILAAIKLCFDKKYLAGGVIMALGMAINVYANHLQITYYLFITSLIWVLVELFFAIKNGVFKDFAIAVLVMMGGAAIGISTNASSLWTTYEYGKESTRGGSDLTIDSEASSDGLDYAYIFDDYSYGHIEVLTFLIPNFSGGASTMNIDKKSELARALGRSDNLPTYWGDQRYVAGPYYLGAILIFLMVLAFTVGNRRKTELWIVVVGVLALLLSMGKNFFLSDLFYNYFPLYKKFRTPTMITAITQIAIAMLAALGLQALWNKREEPETLKKLNLAFYITGGLTLFLALVGPSLFGFTSATDEQIGIKDQMLSLFQDYRADMMRKDAFRSFALIAIAWALLWAMLKNKLNGKYAMPLLAIIILTDQWVVNKRYMSGDTYKRKTNTENLYVQSNSDKIILEDKDLGYRVFNLTVSPFNDATTSYYHKSIGGYHGAKLRRYQELIEYGITPQMQVFQEVLKSQNVLGLDSTMSQMGVLNMLNCRYFIINPEGAPLKNPYGNGAAWFVNEVREVQNADDELMGLQNLNTKNTALVDVSRFGAQLNGFKGGAGEGEIRLVSYAPNHLVYETKTNAEELAVFSEIYYPYGWQCYIDGEEVEHFRANYVLRALKVPAGTHKIEFKFAPKSYAVGEKISLAGSVSLLLLLLVGIGLGVKRNRAD